MLLSVSTQAQKITLSNLLDGVSNPADTSFQEGLKNNNFSMVSPFKSRLKPESWAYNYNPDTGNADAWVYYYFDRSKLEKKKKKTATIDITVMTFGNVNLLHNRLRNEIKESCKFGGTLTDAIDGHFYDEYVHSSGAFFHIYSTDEENYIKVRNTTKIIYQ